MVTKVTKIGARNKADLDCLIVIVNKCHVTIVSKKAKQTKIGKNEGRITLLPFATVLAPYFITVLKHTFKLRM